MLHSEVGGGGVAGEDLVTELLDKVGGEGVLLRDLSWSSTVLLWAVKMQPPLLRHAPSPGDPPSSAPASGSGAARRGCSLGRHRLGCRSGSCRLVWFPIRPLEPWRRHQVEVEGVGAFGWTRTALGCRKEPWELTLRVEA